MGQAVLPENAKLFQKCEAFSKMRSFFKNAKLFQKCVAFSGKICKKTSAPADFSCICLKYSKPTFRAIVSKTF